MDVPAPLGGVVQRDRGQGRRQGVARARSILTLATGGSRRPQRQRRGRAAQPRPPPASARRTPAPAAPRRPPRGRVDEAAFAHRLRRPGGAQARARARRRSRQVKGTGDKGRILQEDVEAFVKGGAAPAPRRAGARRRAAACGGFDLLPWPKVDFAKFGPVETQAAVAHQEDLRPRTCTATGS